MGWKNGLLAALAGSPVIACSMAAGEPASDEAAHTAGEPTFGQHAWLWANETEAELPEAPPGARLPFDHPVTQRLQLWADRMHASLARDHADKVRHTPAPRIVVLASKDSNAWVSPRTIVWDVKTRSLASSGGTFVEPPDALQLRRDGTFLRVTDRGALSRPHDARDLETFARLFSGSFASCRVDVDGDALVLGTGCVRLGGAGRSDRFAYAATSRFVTVTTAYMKELVDEELVVSTLAHELGHYYRSHPNMPSDLVNYFYALDGTHAHKPAPDPRFVAETARARAKVREKSKEFAEENALMKAERLGFYTHEQEADELSLELLAKVGLAPAFAVDKLLKTLEVTGDDPDPEALKFAECSALRAQGFRDPDGKLAIVPIGDPGNAHHNTCFRAFNLMREIEAHRYEVAPRPAPPAEAWADLVASLGP
jgi:Zn-dependent protease with chaperone function